MLDLFRYNRETCQTRRNDRSKKQTLRFEALEPRQLLSAEGWAIDFTGAGNQEILEMVGDAAGNTYMTGFYTGSGAFAGIALSHSGDRDGFVAKVNSAGSVEWINTFAGVGKDYGSDLWVDGSTVYLVGSFSDTVTFAAGHSLTSRGDADAFLAKLDASDGGVDWVQQAGSSFYEDGHNVRTNSSGDVFVKWNTSAGGDPEIVYAFGGDTLQQYGGGTIVSKLDADGDLIWTKQYSGTAGMWGNGLSVDAAGDVYVGGMFGGTASFDAFEMTSSADGAADVYAAKMDGDSGAFAWTQQMGGEAGQHSMGLVASTDGGVYVRAKSQDTYTFGSLTVPFDDVEDSALARLDAQTGSVEWISVLAGTGKDAGYNVTPYVDASGDVYYAGFYEATPTLSLHTAGSVTTQTTLPTADARDVFVLKLDASGNLKETITFGGPNNQRAREVAVDAAGNLYLSGRYDYEIELPIGSVSIDPDGNASFLTRLTNNELLFADSFENGQWNGLWVEDSQNDWFTSSQRSTEGNYSAEVDGRATDATLTMSTPIDLSSFTSAELTFDWLIEKGFDSGEYLALDISTDGGTSWQNDVLRLNGNSDPEHIWHAENVDLSAYLSADTLIRFRAKASRSNEDANVDNVRIVASGTVGLPNELPTADAGGPYAVDEGSSVTLDGSASSDTDGTIVSYEWDLDNDGQYDDGTGVTASFSSNQDGSNSVGLRVTDDRGGTGTTSATVDVANVDPTAVAGGPYAGNEGSDILLDGSASSDPGNDIVTYAWDFDSDGQYDDASGPVVAFNSIDDGVYDVGLRVTDDAGATSASAATVTVNNVAPTADAGGPYASDEGVDVIVTAAASTDPGADIASYEWDFDNDGQYDDALGVTATFQSASAGAFIVGVRVTDDDGAISTDSATVNVTVASSSPNLAHGVVTGVGSASWTTVTLADSYTSMVVVASANYQSSDAPGVVRIQNATGDSFDVRVDVPGGGSTSGVNVHYIVVEEGVYDEAGFKLEAVKYTSTVTDENNSWAGESRSYQQSYSAPVVVGQVMTYADPDWSVFWAAGSSRTAPPSASALTVGKHVGEDTDVTRAAETIGYLVVESTSGGTIEGLPFVAGVGSDIIRGFDNAPPFQYNYAAMPNAKTAVVSQAGMDGGDGGWAVLYGGNPLPASSGRLDVAIDEDQIANSERKHTTEQVAYFIIDPPIPLGSDTSGTDKEDELSAGNDLLIGSIRTPFESPHSKTSFFARASVDRQSNSPGSMQNRLAEVDAAFTAPIQTEDVGLLASRWNRREFSSLFSDDRSEKLTRLLAEESVDQGFTEMHWRAFADKR